MATPKKRIKKRKVGSFCALHGISTTKDPCPVCFANRAESSKHKKIDDDRWATLEELITAFADAQESDSWKGGGDPEYIPVIEAELELAKLKLRTHIDYMRRYYEETQ